MKRLGLILIALFSAAPGARAGDSDPQAEVRCRQAKDCMPIRGVCGNWTCIARSHEQEFEEQKKQMAPRVECKPYDPKVPAPRVLCVSNRCECKFNLPARR